MFELSPRERIVLAIDTSDPDEAEHLTGVAREAGARFIKLGLEIQTATSWAYCADLAARHDLEWIADAKLDDISHTVSRATRNIMANSYPPFGLTLHAKAGFDSMMAAQDVAGEAIVFGVTELTSIPDSETLARYGKTRGDLVRELSSQMVQAGLRGIVASPQEVLAIKSRSETEHLTMLIPGVRSKNTSTNDQSNTGTPRQTIRDGADLIVIGRQITKSSDPREAYQAVINEIS